jgi:hypothetical protein
MAPEAGVKPMTRRFKAQQTTIIKDLIRLMGKINATSLKIGEQDLLGDDPTATIRFDRAGFRYKSSCSSYGDYMDNLRAAQLALEYTYRIAEVYNVDLMSEGDAEDLFTKLFGAMELPLDPNVLALGDGNGNSRFWWEILGVQPEATRAAIVNAFRALCKVHHPDVGGDAADFVWLQAAYEEGIKQAKK